MAPWCFWACKQEGTIMAEAALKNETRSGTADKGAGKSKAQKATYQDIIDAPPHMVAEIISGALETHPRPRPRHAFASSALGANINSRFQQGGDDGPGGWIILDEPELHLGEDVLVPDIAGWRRENMPELPEAAWFETAPDWLCEVLSPSTIARDRGPKRDIYARENVKHLWLLDPDARLLECFELQEDKQENGETMNRWSLLKTFADDDEVAIAPFAEAPFRLGLLWPDGL
jgi:Uma2 family endonuclease